MTSFPDHHPPASPTPPPEDRFDDLLRQRLADFEADPTPNAWATLSAQLPAPRPRTAPWVAQVGSFTAGMVTGALLWWGTSLLIPTPDAAPAATVPPTQTTAPAFAPLAAATAPATAGLTPAIGGTETVPPAPAPLAETAQRPKRMARLAHVPVAVKHPFAAAEHSAHLNAQPETGAHEAATERTLPNHLTPAAITSFVRLSGVETRDSIIRQRARAYMKPANVAPDTLRTARLRVLVAEQTRDLSLLQARLDSVKRFLPDAPATAPKTPKAGR